MFPDARSTVELYRSNRCKFAGCGYLLPVRKSPVPVLAEIHGEQDAWPDPADLKDRRQRRHIHAFWEQEDVYSRRNTVRASRLPNTKPPSLVRPGAREQWTHGAHRRTVRKKAGGRPPRSGAESKPRVNLLSLCVSCLMPPSRHGPE